MEYETLLTVLTLLLGNGFIITLVGLSFQKHQSKIDKDFEVRKEARIYYKTLFAHVCILQTTALSYAKSIKDGKANAFNFVTYEFEEQKSDEILAEFKSRYNAFSKYYIKEKAKGSEIYVSKRLQNSLIKFWCIAWDFADHNKLMMDEDKIKEFNEVCEKIFTIMEQLFGLHNWEDNKYVMKIKSIGGNIKSQRKKRNTPSTKQ